MLPFFVSTGAPHRDAGSSEYACTTLATVQTLAPQLLQVAIGRVSFVTRRNMQVRVAQIPAATCRQLKGAMLVAIESRIEYRPTIYQLTTSH